MGLCELPRNLRKLGRVKLPQPEPKVFTFEEVRTLWASASNRMRCYMALALNCGFGQQDISDLKASDINLKDGYIERSRSKTGIQSRHALWPITADLLKQEMQPDAWDDDRIFLTAKGMPLVHADFVDGKLKRSHAITNMF